MIIEALEKIVDRFITLLRERQLRRTSFFREIVEPIHEIFNEFRGQHLATFEMVRTRLRSDSDLRNTLEVLSEKYTTESSTWLLFSKLRSIEVTSKVELEGFYEAYLEALQACLANSDGHPGDITFYRGLKHELVDVIREVERARIISHIGVDEQPARNRGLEHVADIASRFNVYCAEVDLRYFRLRQYCLV